VCSVQLCYALSMAPPLRIHSSRTEMGVIRSEPSTQPKQKNLLYGHSESLALLLRTSAGSTSSCSSYQSLDFNFQSGRWSTPHISPWLVYLCTSLLRSAFPGTGGTHLIQYRDHLQGYWQRLRRGYEEARNPPGMKPPTRTGTEE